MKMETRSLVSVCFRLWVFVPIVENLLGWPRFAIRGKKQKIWRRKKKKPRRRRRTWKMMEEEEVLEKKLGVW